MHDVSSHSDFEPGPVHVQGVSALAYARDRLLPDATSGTPGIRGT